MLRQGSAGLGRVASSTDEPPPPPGFAIRSARLARSVATRTVPLRSVESNYSVRTDQDTTLQTLPGQGLGRGAAGERKTPITIHSIFGKKCRLYRSSRIQKNPVEIRDHCAGAGGGGSAQAGIQARTQRPSVYASKKIRQIPRGQESRRRRLDGATVLRRATAMQCVGDHHRWGYSKMA